MNGLHFTGIMLLMLCHHPILGIVFYWVGGFALFAFLTTLTREIIKDIEDFEGDMAYGRNTIPVVTGILTSKIISVILIAITIVILYIVWNFFLHDKITLIYISVLLYFRLLYVIYQLIISSGKRQLHSASRLMKIVQCCRCPLFRSCKSDPRPESGLIWGLMILKSSE